MLIWMCALHCEAKPLIDHYQLQKSNRHRGFDLYQRPDISCIVSGVGALRMAAATAWTAAIVGKDETRCWINLGIAGHRELEVGSLVLANHISMAEQSRNYSLTVDKPTILRSYPLESYLQQQSGYPQHAMVDMEGYAFIHTASGFTDIQWCQSLKVISDNDLSPAHRDKQRISELIAGNMKQISKFATDLCLATQAQQ